MLLALIASIWKSGNCFVFIISERGRVLGLAMTSLVTGKNNWDLIRFVGVLLNVALELDVLLKEPPELLPL